MPTAVSNHDVAQLLRSCATRRAALAEAADALPGLGPLLAGAGAFYQELRAIPHDLPAEPRDLVRAMAGDLRAFLEREASSMSRQGLALALTETFAILAGHGLSAEELVSEAGLVADWQDWPYTYINL